MYNKERLCSQFPSFAQDVQNPATFNTICNFELGKEIGEASINEDFYYDKLSTAIHEAGHILAILLFTQNEKHTIRRAEISCNIIQDAIDKDLIFFGWGGCVLHGVNVNKDDILNSVIHTAGKEAQLAFGIDRLSAGIGSEDDMKKNYLRIKENTKRIGGTDKLTTWSHQKSEYRRFMEQETTTLSLYTKVIIEENLVPIQIFAEALYCKEELSAEDISKLASKVSINRHTLDLLKKYIKEFYA